MTILEKSITLVVCIFGRYIIMAGGWDWKKEEEMVLSAYGVEPKSYPGAVPNEKSPWCTLCGSWATRGHLGSKDHTRRLGNLNMPPWVSWPDSEFQIDSQQPAASSNQTAIPNGAPTAPPPGLATNWSIEEVLNLGIHKGIGKGIAKGKEQAGEFYYNKGKGVGYTRGIERGVEKGKKGAGKNLDDLHGYEVIANVSDAKGKHKGKDHKGTGQGGDGA